MTTLRCHACGCRITRDNLWKHRHDAYIFEDEMDETFCKSVQE